MRASPVSSNGSTSLNDKLILGFILIYPLLFNPFFTFFENFEIPKSTFFILWTIIFVIINHKLLFRKFTLNIIWNHKILLPYSSFVILVILNNIGNSLDNTLFGATNRFDGLLFLISSYLFIITLFLVLNIKPKLNRIDTIIKFLCISGFLASIIATLQFLLTSVNFMSEDFTYDGRIISTIGQPNVLAGFLMLIVPLISITSFSNRTQKVFLLVISLAIILTFSKINILLLIIFVFIKYRKVFKKYYVLSIITVTLILIISIYFFTSNQFYKILEMYPIFYQLQRLFFFTTDLNLHNSMRLSMLNDGVNASIQNWFRGYGVGTIENVLPNEYYMRNYGVIVNSTHNIFLDKLIESGIFAVSVFVYFLYLLLKNAFKKREYYYGLIFTFFMFMGFFT